MSVRLRAKRSVGAHGMVGANQPNKPQRANATDSTGVCTFLRVVDSDERVQRAAGNVRTARTVGRDLHLGTHTTFAGTQYREAVMWHQHACRRQPQRNKGANESQWSHNDWQTLSAIAINPRPQQVGVLAQILHWPTVYVVAVRTALRTLRSECISLVPTRGYQALLGRQV